MQAPREPPGEGVAPRVLAVAGALGLAALLFALRTRLVVRDAVAYGLQAKTGTNLFHPHHVAFTAVIHWMHAGLARLGLEVDTIALAQAHNALFAGAAIVGFACWLRGLPGARRLGAVELGAPLLVLGCSIVLEFATQPESYVPALACAIGALAALGGGARRVRLGRALLAGALLALAVLYHQLAVLFALQLPVPALAMEGARRRAALREALAAVAVGGALELGAYVAAHRASGRGGSLLEYCTWYLQMGQDWGRGTRVGAAGLAELGSSLARGVLGTDRGPAGLLALGLVALVVIENAVAAVRGASSRELRIACLAWALLLLGFLLWWLPGQVNYFGFVLPPCAALAMLTLRDACGERAARPIAVALGLALVASSFARQVVPHHRAVNADRERAAALHGLGAADWVRICDLPTAHWLWYDFDDTRVLPVSGPLAAAAQGLLGAQRARPDDPLRGAGGIVIPLQDLLPDLDAAALARVAPDDPAGPWLDFAAWLFDLRDEPGGATRRAFEVRRLRAGELAVAIDGRREPCADTDALLEELDRQVAAQAEGGEAGRAAFRFAEWRRAQEALTRR